MPQSKGDSPAAGQRTGLEDRRSFLLAFREYLAEEESEGLLAEVEQELAQLAALESRSQLARPEQ